jgi:hypothetical protein
LACKERQRKKKEEQRYGVDEKVYNCLMEEQNNCCAICKQDETLIVDHNHQPGKVRGLLCSRCNTALGFLNDDPTRMMAAIKYLDSKTGIQYLDRYV